MAPWVAGFSVDPCAPEDAEPGAREGADYVGMIRVRLIARL